MKLLVLDTNILLRFLLNDIPSQAKVLEKKLKLAKNGKVKLIIPQIVIFEIVYALIKEYKLEKEKVVNVLQKLLINQSLQIQDKNCFQEAFKIYLKTNLSLADLFVYVYSQNIGAELITFDKKLQKLSSG